uniref:C-type lectin domain family 10 member A-like n=1 Tax=Labrus bergylta TaxID=56723 RepID=A0A3Q3FE74_9LABR
MPDYHREQDTNALWIKGICLSLSAGQSFCPSVCLTGINILLQLNNCLPPCFSDGLPVSLSVVSFIKRWLFPALTATVIFILIIVLGVSSEHTHTRARTHTHIQVFDTYGDLCLLIVILVETISSLYSYFQTLKRKKTCVVSPTFPRQRRPIQCVCVCLCLVSEALKQLSVVDYLSRSVASLKCSLERIVNNGQFAQTHTVVHLQYIYGQRDTDTWVPACLSGSGIAACCPPHWDQFDYNCYYFSTVSLSWNESRLWCEKKEFWMISFCVWGVCVCVSVQDFVTRHAASRWFWVGLSDWRTGRWEWINRTPYTIEHRRWMPGQPDNWFGHGLGPGGEDCAHMHNDGRLNDQYCSTKMRFVCQKHSTRG